MLPYHARHRQSTRPAVTRPSPRPAEPLTHRETRKHEVLGIAPGGDDSLNSQVVSTLFRERAWDAWQAGRYRGDTSAARPASGQATPATRSGHADHPPACPRSGGGTGIRAKGATEPLSSWPDRARPV